MVHSGKIPFLESVLIVKDLGVQFTKSGVLGLETSQFIEQHKIVDVLINEVITMVCILPVIDTVQITEVWIKDN